MYRALLAVLILFGGCNPSSSGGEGGGDGGGVDAGEDDAGPGPAVDPFVLRVTADSAIGVAGQAFRVEATPDGEVPADIAWRWSAETGDGEADGPVFTVRFADEGPHEITVEAEADGVTVTSGAVLMVYPAAPILGDVDGDGETAEADLALLQAFLAADATLDDAAEARADLNRDLDLDGEDVRLLEALLRGEDLVEATPVAGSRGTLVQLMHPALLDPAARLAARFDGAELPLNRGAPGFATIIVPLEAGPPRAVVIELMDGEAVLHGYAFEVLDPPAVRGDEVPESFEKLQGAIELMPPLIEAYLADLEVPDDERALMTAMFQAVAEQFAEQRAAFAAHWDQLSEEQQAIYTEVALANGLDQALADLDAIALRMRTGMQQISTERLIELVCLARDLSKVTKVISQVNNIAGYVIDALWFLSFFFPPLAGVVAGLQTANTFIAAVMDVMQLLLEFVPRFGDRLTLTADPTELMRDAETNIVTTIKVQIAGGLCAGGAAVATKLILDKLKERLFERLFGRIPGFGRYFRRARHQRGLIARMVTSIARFLGQIIDTVVERSGIEDRFKAMAAAVCDAIVPGQPWELSPGSLTWEADCGIAVDGAWQCTDECADQRVTITARISICGDAVEGSTRVECAPCRASCPDGCCTADGVCVDQADQSEMQCGAEGRRCQACVADQACRDGECQCVSTCAEEEVGTGRCADAATAETCEAASDGCFRWTPTDCAAGGATCEDGVCVGGCGVWNCGGCCTGEHMCVGIDDQSTEQCGRGGNSCLACAQGDECVGGECECRGPDCDPPLNPGSRGDPHLITFDGLAYDFQGAGEFVLARDPDDAAGFEVQVRQVPLRDPVCAGSVTVNQAVALQVGGSRVTFDPTRARLVWVDGVAVELPVGEVWPLGEAELMLWQPRRLQVRWADGSEVRLTARAAVDIGIQVAPGRVVEGLLGDANGDPADDLRLGDGTALPRPIPFEVLYGAFADAWRVTADSSLFEYAPGEGPDTWAIPGYPEALADPATLDPAVRAAAEETCDMLGVADPVLLDACVLDLACSGDPGFVSGLVGLDPPTAHAEVTPPDDPELPQEILDACRATPRDRNGRIGATFLHTCPAECVDVECTVWGSDVYTDDSCICRAAIHAGVLEPGQNNRVEVQHLEGQPGYRGSERNGIATRDYGAWDDAFQFPDAIPACKRSGADLLVFEPIGGCRDGNWYCHDCPAACDVWPVWGTDNYHEYSSLCSAAVHAGVVDAEAGGRIFFTFPIFDDAYDGSVRNGIESLDREPHPVSFEFRLE